MNSRIFICGDKGEKVNLKDFTFNIKIKPININKSSLVILIRYRDESNYYSIKINIEKQSIQLFKVIQGIENKLAEEKVRINSKSWYKVRIEVENKNIRCYIDNLLAININDDTSAEGNICIIPNKHVEYEMLDINRFVRSLPLSKETRVEEWYLKAKLGLFIHWGTNIGNFDWKSGKTPPPYKNAEEFENAALQNGWSADKWVKTAKEIGAQYIILTTFHSTCGYLRVWPSNIPGTPFTKRDFLQEIIDSAQKEDIKVIIYMTNQASWAIDKYNKLDGVNWTDPQAYSLYKDDSTIDIAKRENFINYFVKDVMDELFINYPKISGFWYDGWDTKDESNRIEEEIFEYVHSRMPEAINIKNNYNNIYAIGEDVMSLEDWKGAHNFANAPDTHYGVIYHYNLPNYTSMPPTIRESSFKTIGGWKYGDYIPELSEHPDDIKRIITIISNNWVAVPGYGPTISGDFPEPLTKFHERLAEFMTWAKESIHNTMGGGHGQGGFAPGYWNDGFAGVTTFIPNENTHYIHVLEMSENKDKLIISDCGYNVLSAFDLKTGSSLSFKQELGLLHIDFIATHESDTIIKLITDNSKRVIKIKELSFRTSSDKNSEKINSLSDLTIPIEIEMKWEVMKDICGLKIVQSEDTGIPNSNRIKDVELFAFNTSGDKKLIKSGQLHNQRGMQVISFDPIFSDSFSLEVANNYNNTSQVSILDIELIYLDGK